MGTADPDTKRRGLITSLLPEEALALEVSQRVWGRSLVRGRGLAQKPEPEPEPVLWQAPPWRVRCCHWRADWWCRS